MGMQLHHEFTVPAPIDRTWAEFNDLEGVAACFPGATVTEVDGDSFKGTVKVKLGPIALQYAGSGNVRERDEGAHRLLIKANGKDKRGNGTAGADVIATLEPDGEATHVVVLTDLAITGKPAQFGRGVMQDVSDKLLQQFVACLENKLGGEPTPAQDPHHLADPSAADGPQTLVDAPVASAPPAPAPTDAGEQAGPGGQHRAVPPTVENDAIDLGATVLPVLVKTYWKQALGALLVLLVLRRLLSH